MPWPQPQHGNARITAAGKIISGRKMPNDGMDMDSALSVAANWRSSHGYPLHVFKMLLHKRARFIDQQALVFGRQKRLPSIIKKLQRFHAMQLATMQDLGGCRAVVRSVSHVDQLVALYKQKPTTAARFVDEKDYIADPKPDGYRSVHLIYEYLGKGQCSVFCGLKIEVQIRSSLQHAWATALETIDTFTHEALKSGLGNDRWKRFFALMASAISIREKRPIVPGTPSSKNQLREELVPLCKQLKVPDVFYGLPVGLKLIGDQKPKGVIAYILELDFDQKITGAIGFESNEETAEEYMKLEKNHLGNPNKQVVLVSADSLASLKKGYPSYYLDTRIFTRLINDFIA